MPLETAALSANCQFDFVRPVSGWADLTQGPNQVTFGGAIDTAVWDSAYAAVLSLAGGASATIDLSAVTTLAGESVALTAVVGIVVQVTPDVAENADVTVAVSAGASNGLEWFTSGTEALTIRANGALTIAEDASGAGVPVDGTHKTLKFENTGADAGSVRVVIIGTTL
ncbi:MAG TPA: hypothetical protein VGE74_10620 [Gemmata sp.]